VSEKGISEGRYLFRGYWAEFCDLVDEITYPACGGVFVGLECGDKDHLVGKNAITLGRGLKGVVHCIDWWFND